MANKDTRPVDLDAAALWILKDEHYVRLRLPPVTIAGRVKPLNVFLDMDAGAVDDAIARLVELRSKMLPRRN